MGPANTFVLFRWHEHDPMDLYKSVTDCIEEAMKKFLEKGYSKTQIKAIGLTNQRETIVCWDKHTGEPLCNAVVWPTLGLRTWSASSRRTLILLSS